MPNYVAHLRTITFDYASIELPKKISNMLSNLMNKD